MNSNSGPRISTVTSKADVPAPYHHHLERILETRGRIRGPYSVLFHCPELAGQIGHVGEYIRFNSDLPDTIRECTILATAQWAGCTYVWEAHEPIARSCGVDEQTINSIATNDYGEELSDEIAVIIAFARELLNEHRISDETYAKISEVLQTPQLVELTATIGYYTMLAWLCNAFEVESR